MNILNKLNKLNKCNMSNYINKKYIINTDNDLILNDDQNLTQIKIHGLIPVEIINLSQNELDVVCELGSVKISIKPTNN